MTEGGKPYIIWKLVHFKHQFKPCQYRNSDYCADNTVRDAVPDFGQMRSCAS